MGKEAETKNSLQALQASEIQYRRLFETAQDGILILNAETGLIDDVNPYMIDMLHYSLDEFVGMKIWEVSPFKDTVFNKEAFEELQDKGYIRYKDLPLETKEGKPIAVEFVSNVYKVNGDKVIQCNIRNITERKQAEEGVRASLREKEILLLELHHRVKNNMEVISGLLDLQARSSGNPELIEMLNKSQSRIRSMALVHEQLYASKDLARINMVVYVRALSQELLQAYNIAPGKIDMIVQTDGDVYVDINKAIPSGLILNELISNALKHAFPGDRPGELRIIIQETKNKEIEIVVRDNGLGLPDDVDIHQSRSMGLYLVNGLVKKQLEGQIEVRRDNGTEFRIKFPL
jgi:PAS domain S-box-containing protein